MSKPSWTPWHQVVTLREDLRNRELSLAVFAADLYDVAMGKARPVYQDPTEFFALTYPTYNLRELAKDVANRLAGRNEKAVRQLELTYGGGKTHALITLYHLTNEPQRLPDLPAIREFVEHIGLTPPRARIAVLAFDKLDAEKGMEVRGPSGERRWLKQPWSVLAFQLAGAEGLRLLHAEGLDEERETAPAENLLTELLARPAREDRSTLILVDEVLTYAREKAGLDPVWRGRLVNFFQYLTQAATKIDRCAIVASLLATDPRKSDQLGKELTQELYAIFRREREEGVQPVVKEDVAEILRRRFFTPESIRDREVFRAHVVAALKGIADLDEETSKQGKAAEERFLASYPFHPDLTEVFYTKWTNLEAFQRTRGVLRTFALALRAAEAWDQNPLVGVNVFLAEPGQDAISEAGRELTTVAAIEEYEGKKQEWTGILEGELAKAREIQREVGALRFREVEQAVFATFLHSQPIGHKAQTRELLVLLGPTRPDRIELEKALRRWAEVSWFLDEAAIQEAGLGNNGEGRLPKSWQLGSKPNLRQMHHDACTRVSGELVEAKLLEEIGRLKSLTDGAKPAGAVVHNLPERPRDVDDDGEFHYAVLGPKAASEPGRPSAEARRFLDETTGPDRPRVYRNAVVLAVPARDGLEAARNAVRDYLGWEEVRDQLKGETLDFVRESALQTSLLSARRRIPDFIRQAYSLAALVSEKNEVEAIKITLGDEPLFNLIKKDRRSRIQETEVSAEALLPGGPYALWREGETSRRVKDLVGAFAQFPHLPKMLHRQAILDTLISGCLHGLFVLRLPRPDRSFRTFYYEMPDGQVMKDPALEVVLAEAATLSNLSPSLLTPGTLPGLWGKPEITFGDIVEYFGGGRVVMIPREGYEEPRTVPKAERTVVAAAVQAAVREGKLWLTAGPVSLLGEEIPEGILSDDAVLQAPPPAIPPTEILPEHLSEAWAEGRQTTALAVYTALCKRFGKLLPWKTVREALNEAYRVRLVEPENGSAAWEYAEAGQIRLRATETELPQTMIDHPPIPKPGVLAGEARLEPHEIQELAERMGDLTKAAVGLELTFRVRVELGGADVASEAAVRELNGLLGEVSPGLRLQGG